MATPYRTPAQAADARQEYVDSVVVGDFGRAAHWFSVLRERNRDPRMAAEFVRLNRRSGRRVTAIWKPSLLDVVGTRLLGMPRGAWELRLDGAPVGYAFGLEHFALDPALPKRDVEFLREQHMLRNV